MIGPGRESEAPSNPTVELLVEYDQAKGVGAQTQALQPEARFDDVAALACVDLLHRAWPSGGAAIASTILPTAAVLGDFRIVREIGRGGMGVVYEAEQLTLQRRVALKVLPQAAFLDEGRLARFELEARTAATLDHPHIVPIFSIGCEQNVHYYAMKLIRGVTLAELYRQRTSTSASEKAMPNEASAAALTTSSLAAPKGPLADIDSRRRPAEKALPDAEPYFEEIAGWGIQAADALHFSHERGVIHRDIKPANLIVDATGKLWITDFGLARLNDDAAMTYTGDLVGTLRYTSPERLKGGSGVSQQVDVYSLGVTLYEMLALQPAFDGGDRPIVLRQIMENDPRPLRQVNPRIPADLETIIAKAIEKEPAQRYLSAREFAADLRRFLTDQPIQARGATISDRVLKWAKRHKTLAHATLVFGGLLILLLGVSTLLIQRSLRETADLLYVADVGAAYAAWGRGENEQVREILARHIPSSWETDRRGLEWRILNEAVAPAEHIELLGHIGPVNEIAVFPDQRRLASVGADGTLRIWELASGELLRTVKVCGEALSSVAISDNGKLVAVGSTCAYLCDADGGDPPEEILRHEFTIDSLAFSPNGEKLFAGARYHEVIMVSLEDRKVSKFPSDARIESLECLPAGTLLVPNRRPGYADDSVGVIQFINPDSMEVMRELDASSDMSHPGRLTVARSSSSGEYILAGETYDSTAYLFESQSGKKVAQTPVSRVRLTDVAISSDGTSIGIGYRDGVVEVFRVQLQPEEVLINERPQIVHAHVGELLSLKFVGSTLLATAGMDGAIRLWKLPRQQPSSLLCGETELTGLSLSPDGKYFAYTSLNGYGAIHVESGSATFRRRQPSVAFEDPVWSHRSDQFSIVARDEAVLVTVGLTGEVARTKRLRERPEKMAYSPRGEALALAGPVHLSILNSKTGAEAFHSDAGFGNTLSVCYSGDGESIALGNDLGRVTVIQNSNYRQTAQTDSRGEVDALCFSPDNQLLASGHRDGVVRLWNLDDGELAAELRGHEMGVADLLFSDDGTTLVSASQTGIVRMWSVKHARLYGVLFDPAWDGFSAGRCGLDLTTLGDRLAVGYRHVPDDVVDMMLWQAK